MTKQIDKLMALIDGYAITPNKACRDILRTALEAALKPGEPVYAFRRKGLDDYCTCDARRYLELKNKPHMFEVTIFYRAAPPAQTPPKDDFISKRAQFDAEWSKVRELQRQCREFIEKQKTPPPRLTDEELNCAYRKSFGLIDSRLVGDQISFSRAIETAVLKQAGWPE
jgi:hypothetical protein